MYPDEEYSEFWEKIKEHTIEKNEILKDFYTKFENMCSSDNNQQYCEMQDGKYGDYNDVEKLYYKFNGNKAKYELENQEFATLFGYPIRFCNYLKYWLYHKIIFYKFDKEKITEVLKKFQNGDKIQLVIGSNYTCNFNRLELEKIKNIKLFYDYIGSYDSDKKESSIRNKICGSSYKETLNRMIDLYNDRNIKEGCSEVYSSSQYSYPSDNHAAKLSQDPYHVRDKNTSLGIIMTVIPTLAILFVIFPILYKLISFGPWLHKFVMKTKNSLLNANKNSTDTLLNHISESGSENFMERPHYIAYHSY
ncbi:PIR Superfamily Protein [Plasmodium ovale curtisi]|uniref:PIR Superfamily Protein n=1 Tax=Plasmodium ovale curtisi TaxID=864141 RepID=A0A1A8X535_PLAOA|nr:PIR Superfamily Protein [Plasmodium ovale curtisi]